MKQAIIVLTILALSQICSAQGMAPFNGGNKFTTMHGNPAMMNKLLSQFQSELNITTSTSCNEIPGVGFPVLAIRQALQILDTSLDHSNRHTYAKIIFLDQEEIKRPLKTVYKLVVQIKTIKDVTYIGIEAEYRQNGHPPVRVNTYYVDSNLSNVEKIMGVKLDENAYIGCGDVKKIYSQKNPVLPSPNYVVNGNQTHAHNAPFSPGRTPNNNGPAFGSLGTNVNTQQLAQILAAIGTQ